MLPKLLERAGNSQSKGSLTGFYTVLVEADDPNDPVGDAVRSIVDGLGMGIGFTIALVVIGAIREILGAGQLLGFDVLPQTYKPVLVAILAPGAFLVMGLLMGLMNLKKK